MRYILTLLLLVIPFLTFSQKKIYTEQELAILIQERDNIHTKKIIIDSVQSQSIIHYKIIAYYIDNKIEKIEYYYHSKETSGFDKYYYDENDNLIYYHSDVDSFVIFDVMFFSKKHIKINMCERSMSKKSLLDYIDYNSNFYLEHFKNVKNDF